MLEQPVLGALRSPRRVLLAGCGGGYDILGGVALRHALLAAGIEVELASLSCMPCVLACVGMTAELRDRISHAQVFERIAELTREGGYLGASALVPGTPATDTYVAAVKAVFAGQERQKKSHVHKVIVQALEGGFGATAPHVWLSALASMYWFFDAHTVARTHRFLDELGATDSIWDVAARVEAARKALPIREHAFIPI